MHDQSRLRLTLVKRHLQRVCHRLKRSAWQAIANPNRAAGGRGPWGLGRLICVAVVVEQPRGRAAQPITDLLQRAQRDVLAPLFEPVERRVGDAQACGKGALRVVATEGAEPFGNVLCKVRHVAES